MARKRFVAPKKMPQAASGAKSPLRQSGKRSGPVPASGQQSGRRDFGVVMKPRGGLAEAGIVGVKPSSVMKQQPPGRRLRILPASPEVNLWRGLCRPSILAQALVNIGTLVEVDQLLPSASEGPSFPFSALTEERLQVAAQALVDAEELLRSVTTEEKSPHDTDSALQAAFLHERWGVVCKLVELAEAAVPMKFSILFDRGSAGVNNGAAAPGLPPTSLCALRGRLLCIRRLSWLRKYHVGLVPMLRQVRTKGEAAAVLFGPTANETDFVEPMSEMGVMHQREQDVVRDLLEQLNGGGPCTDSWGSPFVPPLCVSSGAYILMRHARSEALARLLRVTEFFGLPPFLRSIRVSEGRLHPLTAAGANDSRSTAKLLPSLFLSPRDLNPRHYNTSGGDQDHVVQEELMDLVSRHCRFGVVAGEADQVIPLLRASVRHHSGKERNPKVKVEKDTGVCAPDGAVDCSRNTGTDPLAPHAAAVARDLQGGGCSSGRKGAYVHWLCSNRWNRLMSYYAIVLAVVLPHGCDIGQGEGAVGQGDVEAVYYVSALCELTRS